MKPVLLLFILCSLAASLFAAAPSKPHLFQLRLVLDELTSDSEKMTMTGKTGEGQSVPVVLNVAKGALLDEADIQSAAFQSDPVTGRPQVAIIFTKEGQKMFSEITKTNVNKQLAILIDGKLVEAPIIRTQIKDGKAFIGGGFSEKEAKELAARINKAVEGKHDRKMKPWPYGPYDGREVRPR